MNDNFVADLYQEVLGTVGVAPDESTPGDLMLAVAQSPRQQLAERWVETQAAERSARARRVYYLSMEFLIGRSLGNALAALGLRDDSARAVSAHARRLEDVEAQELDAALGNGG